MGRAIFRASAWAMLSLLLGLSPGVIRAQVTTIFGSVTGRVSDTSGKAIKTAAVSLDSAAAHLKAMVDVNGTFAFTSVAPGNYVFKVTAAGYEGASQSNIVVTSEPLNFDIRLAAATGLKEIGHVAASSRSAINTSGAAVYTMAPQDFQDQGQTNWRTILEEIPGVNFGLNPNISSGAAGNPFAQTIISIRGTAGYENATLFDNMPMSNITATDRFAGDGNLSNYTPDSFSAVSVVEGPGSASPTIVGSINGSLNLRAPGVVTQNHYSVSAQNDIYGGLTFASQAAYRIGRLSLALSYDNENSPGPSPNSQQFLPRRFFSSILSINGQPFTCSATCAATPIVPNTSPSSQPVGYTIGLIGCCQVTNTNWGQYSGSASLFYQVSPTVTAQMFYAGSSQNQDVTPLKYPYTFIAPSGYAGGIPSGQTIPTNSSFTYITQIFSQHSALLEAKIVAQVGRGQLQLAGLSNVVEFLQTQTVPANYTLQLYGGGTLNGLPAVFNGGTYNVVLKASRVFSLAAVGRTDNRDASLSFTTPLGNSMRGQISWVRSFIDNPYSCTFDSLPPTTSLSYSEMLNEYKLSLGGDISPKVSIDASGYLALANFHVVDPTGNGFTYTDVPYHYVGPRMTLRWRPTSEQSFRFSMGGGFALPTLTSISGVNSPPGLNPNGNYYQFISNPFLHPETSWGYDVGYDRRLSGNTIVSLDLYTNDLHGQIGFACSPAGTYLGSPLYNLNAVNLQHSKYQGIDLAVQHDAARGIFWSASGSLQRAYVVSAPPGFYDLGGATCDPVTLVNCQNLSIIPGQNFNTLSGTPTPYAQGFAQAGYRWNASRFVSVDAHYEGNNNSYGWPAFFAFDANARIPIARFADIQGSFLNITNIHGSQLLNLGNATFYPQVFGPPASYPPINYTPRSFIVTLRLHG